MIKGSASALVKGQEPLVTKIYDLTQSYVKLMKELDQERFACSS